MSRKSHDKKEHNWHLQFPIHKSHGIDFSEMICIFL
jgi:hypothetical protein